MTDVSELKSLASGDFAQPFLIDHSNIRGRVVRLNEVVDTILTRHAYPEPVSRLLGELLVVAAMLSGNLKHDGVLTLQVKGGEGLVRFIVVDVEYGGKLRGYAELAEGAAEVLERMEKNHVPPSLSDMVGNGYMAITLDNPYSKQPYQGIVELTGNGISDTVQNYFTNSEQSEVRLKICVGSMQYGGEERAQWCAGGMLLQHVPGEGGKQQGWSVSDEAGVKVHDAADEAARSMRGSAEPDPELWQRIALFYDTLKPYELLDPLLPAEELLYRLFNEDGVWMYDTAPLVIGCRCSRERIAKVLSTLPADELETLVDEEGYLSVNCQFCNKAENFTLGDIGSALPPV